MRHRLIAPLGVVVALVVFITPATTSAHDLDGRGTIYTISNAAGGNAVLAYARRAGGSLRSRGTFASGGLGTGAVLASQGAVTLPGERDDPRPAPVRNLTSIGSTTGLPAGAGGLAAS